MSQHRHQYTDPFEDAPWCAPKEIFARLGYHPKSPGSIRQEELPGMLWEFIYAMAGRRFYLLHTNHLSDRELYHYLFHEWLLEKTADTPPESGWNCHIDLAESSEGDTEIWFRYYADEVDRHRAKFEDESMDIPEHEDPPYDRDRWLPVPPLPISEDDIESDDEDDIDDEEEDGEEDDTVDYFSDQQNDTENSESVGGFGNDPLGLSGYAEAVDMEYLQDDSNETGDFSSINDDDIQESHGDFDAHGNDLGPGRWARPIDSLPEFGVALLPPAELTDESINPRLWELMHALSCLGFYLRHTDHLTDRELYESLWQVVLRSESFLPGPSTHAAWTHDFLGSGTEEDEKTWLTYYASEEERRAYFPQGQLPKKRPTIAKRDWLLPRSPSGL